MKLQFIILMTMVLVGFSVQAEECEPSNVDAISVSQQLLPGKVSCYGRACYYIPQKASVGTLIREVRKSVTGSIANLLGIRDGYVGEGRDRSELSFWHRCQSTLDEMKVRVIELDEPILSTGRRRIQLWVKIYHITSQTLNNFSFGITGIFDGAVDTSPARGSVTNTQGNFDMSFAFGNLTNHLLNVNLMGSKGSSNAYELRSVPFEILEGENIERSLTKKIYRDSTSIGDVAIEDTGYSIKGAAYVDESTGEPIVVIKDFHIFYGIAANDSPNVISQALNVHRQEISIPRGRPYILNAENLSLSSVSKKRGLPLYLEDSNVRSESKLMVFVSGWPVDTPPPTDSNLVPLNKGELAELNPKPSQDLLKTAEFSVLSTEGSADFDLIQFQLDKDGLSHANYNEVVRITVNGPGLKDKVTLAEAQHMVTGQFQLPSVFGAGNESEVALTVKLEWADLKRPPRGHKKSVLYKLRHRQSLKSVKVLSRK